MPISSDRGSENQRIVALEGGCNFRDIGGYRTQDGRAVRWGRIYRAGVLSYFTATDRDRLLGLGIQAICDLRRAEEREREPTAWPGDSVRPLVWDDGDAPTIRAYFTRYPNSGAGMREAMMELYRTLPLWMAPRLRGFLECVVNGQTPVLVHCAAGKDRTGIAIAVLLEMLGVSREVIVEDYLLTNHTTDYEQFVLTRQAARLGLSDAKHPLMDLPQEVRSALFGAEVEYLEAALHQIDSQFGGVNEFVRSILGIDVATRRQIENHLLD